MPYRLNKKISDLTPYEPLKGNYRIRLDANESPFSFDEEIKRELKNAMDEVDFNRYPDPMATETAKAFADYYGISADYITVSNGSDEMLSILESTFLEKGDRVLVLSPDFSMYQFYSSLYETECITMQKSRDLTIDLSAASDIINKEKISMVIFSNPCNPTGQGIESEKVRKFIQNVNSIVVLDEAYMDFWNESLIKEAHTYDNLILLRTASKAVGAAALRLGFAVANKTLTTALRAVKSPYNVNSISQKFGTIIYKNKNKLENYQKNIVKFRDLLYNNLLEIHKYVPDFSPIPTCANFVLIKTPDAKEIFDFLLENSIAVRHMGAYLRITAGKPDEISVLINFIKEFFKQRGVTFANC